MVELIGTGKLSSVEVVSSHFERIEKHNSEIQVVVTFRKEEALEEVRAADRARALGTALGKLHGLPLTLKDAFRVRGVRTTYGLPQGRNYVPRSDCELVRRLRQAGAIIIGRTNLPFASFDWQCNGPVFKECVNPWNQ